MKRVEKRCIIGEGPIWNEKEKKLYYVNGFGDELCIFDPDTGALTTRPVGAAAIAFSKDGRIILSRGDGVFFLNEDDSLTSLYDTKKYEILYGNDMKVGPDGCVYVGTQSEKRMGASDKVNGKLYRITPDGEVTTLLDDLLLSNGLAWSMDETRFYHTDSDTKMVREYDFDKQAGTITSTGRELFVPGVDGFTIDAHDRLIVGAWGKGHITVVNTQRMEIERDIDMPVRIPTSCSFCGEDMKTLAITTASYRTDLDRDPLAGFLFLMPMEVGGKLPYLFG
ncbi:MAG: SMP-30/gluconolactonase/LRE family protein [Clostridia bacterium]|nr:SMP-30/gluconolactonase/LRE family protein [Clostridia bacterium]